MYLKSLEIQGFKSFPDKTVLQFGREITAIVGPNGSGKSNISDAILWVMGEQSSKALRGAKMEDVIFGGTQKRREQGFAEVSLLLDNEDHALRYDAPEVMVTRRYYRSGESEYYINKKSARLRDINELFMDTGLGREGYSNIGQGRIDEILALKSTDRREIFEEAAGISKYRHRKEETERRLAATEDNLMRIGDKIAELELQVEPLRVQAEKAKKFLLLRDELRGLEIAVWLDKLDQLSEAAKKAEHDFQSASQVLAQSHADLDSLYALAERLAAEIRTRDQDTESRREAITALEQQQAACKSDCAVLQSEMAHNAQNVTRIRQELEAESTRTSSLQTQIEEKAARRAELEERLIAKHASLTDAERQADALAQQVQALAQQLQTAQGRLEALQELTTQYGLEKTSLAAAAEELAGRQASLRSQRVELKARHADASAKLAEQEQKRKAAQEAVTATKNALAGHSLRAGARRDQTEKMQQAVQQLQVEQQTTASKLKMLREMERDFEGYSRAVRVVMQEAQRGGLRNIHGPVSQLIRADDAYTIAVETALSSAMQHIVVSTEEDGKAAINLLRRRDAGRSTFLPLSAIRGRLLQETGLAQMRGFVGIASDLVRYQPQYREIIVNLLGRTVIAENLDLAIPIARAYHNRFRIVTLDGQVVNAGGSLTGGSVMRSAGVLSRANEITRLEEQQAKREQTLRDRSAALAEAKRQLAESEYAMESASGTLREAEDDALRLEGECKQCGLLADAASLALHECEQELETITMRLQEGESKQGALSDQEKSSADALQALRTELTTAQQQHADASAALEQRRETVYGLQAEIAALETEKTGLAGSIRDLMDLASELQGSRAEKEALANRYLTENDELQAKISALQTQAQQLQEQTDTARQALQASLAERNTVEQQKTTAEKDSQTKSREILELERESARLEQKKSMAELEEKQLHDKLWESYELTYSAAQEIRQPVESIPAATRRIGELKRSISALGAVNVGAIEDFARINERYTYLTEQRDDVLTSREELTRIIEDITVQMTEIFVREFERINRFFGETFREMFGGGSGALILEDPQAPLECGIEIRVQPPGKQVKTITLLSGGEKAFVAIALYFSIMKVRPTPFCMLDEIDAALDEQNVKRFAGYMRGLGGKTQFIVVTHRRGTQEEADTLYGVTMKEQGVSSIFRLPLDEISEELNVTE